MNGKTREALRKARAFAAPAAPVAQEPVALEQRATEAHALLRRVYDSGFDDDCVDAVGDWLNEHHTPPAAEQPDAWTPSGADYDRNIHRNPDAAAWADLFVATFPGLVDKRDLMLGWFANAMMAMHDHLKAQQPDTVAVPRELLEDTLHEVDLLLDHVNWLLQYAGSTGDDAQHGEAISRMRALLAGGAE